MPLLPAVRIDPSPEKIEAIKQQAIAAGFDASGIEQLIDENKEVWKNDRYTVTVRRHEDGWITVLSVRRNDRKPDVPWRHLQRIKSQLAGDEAEAFEIFPAESRLVDTANQRWLWCLPPGEKVPAGFDDGRHVSGPAEAVPFGAVQAPLDA
jgi:hypothetical protein